MTITLRAACIQNCATSDVRHNIAVTLRLAHEAREAGAALIAFPEYFSGLRTEGPKIMPVAFAEDGHPVIAAFAGAARELSATLLLGSLGIKSSDGRIYNRSYLIDRQGRIAARYDRIHMFDVDLGEGRVVKESATIAPGNEAVVAFAEGARLGLSVCYDLRFAYLYRSLAQAGAEILAVPAAFTKVTGQAHWHVLSRARAIENGAYVLAPCQFGTLEGGAECYGHSLIVDPWGRVLAEAGEAEGVIVADIDLAEVEAARRRIPSLTHDRPLRIAGRAEAAE